MTAEIEDEIQSARRLYNSHTQAYNTKIQVFPNSLVARSGGFQPGRYFQIDDEDDREPAAVEFTRSIERRGERWLRHWSASRGAAAIAGLAWFFFGPRRARGAAVRGDRQEVEVTVKGGYSPNLIRARQGVPLRLVFDRQEAGECTSRVVFPDLGVSRSLPPSPAPRSSSPPSAAASSASPAG